MTAIAHALARQLALSGYSYQEIWTRVRDAGFRITAEEAIAVRDRFGPVQSGDAFEVRIR